MKMKDTEKMEPIDKTIYLFAFGIAQAVETTVMLAAQPLQYVQAPLYNMIDKYRGEPTSRVKNRRLRNAVAFGQPRLVKYAVEKGGNADQTTGFSDQTLLGYAAEMGFIKTAAALLDAGATVDLPRADGATPLISAVQEGKTAAINLLIERGASLEACKKDGTTPLLAAVDKGLTPLVKLLADKGAKTSDTRSGQSAADIATEKGYADIAAFLDGGEEAVSALAATKPAADKFNENAAPAATGQAITVTAPIVLKQPQP
jgi:hypothetical protein